MIKYRKSRILFPGLIGISFGFILIFIYTIIKKKETKINKLV